MRDNHKGMPEIIDAFERDKHYFAVLEIEIDGSYKKFQFGVLRPGYLALKRVLQLRPFDMMPGLKYRYFYARSQKQPESGKHIMAVRVEQDRDAKLVERIEISQELHASLLWFDRLNSFDEALYLEQKIEK